MTQTPTQTQTATEQVIAIRIEDFLIDAKQPRRFLPADLREQAARPHASGLVIMQALLARAAEGDLEANGYIADLQSLAEDIGQIKVQQPVQVSRVQHKGAAAICSLMVSGATGLACIWRRRRTSWWTKCGA